MPPNLLDALRRELGPSLAFAFDLDRKKLAGAATYAAMSPNEAPLAQLDATVWGSGKKGVLLTSEALYTDARVRVPITLIRSAPSFPDGITGAGRLLVGTTEIGLPEMLTEENGRALFAMLSAVAAYNAGTSGGGVAPFPGPVGELAARFFDGAKNVTLPRFARKEALAAARAAMDDWLDYENGERFLAFCDETVMGDGERGILLTDRRIVACLEDTRASIAYADVRGVTVQSSWMQNDLYVYDTRGPTKMKLIQAHEDAPRIAGFLDARMRLSPSDASVRPLITSTADDPTGARGLLEEGLLDPRVVVAARALDYAARRGWLRGERAAELGFRVGLLREQLAFGRGMHRGWSESPLAARDLVFAWSSMFGAPAASYPEGDRAHVDFRVARPDAQAAKVVDAMGTALLTLAGGAWVGDDAPPVHAVRVTVFPGASTTRFATLGALAGSFAPLRDVAPEIAKWASATLADAEAQLLLLRVVLGPDLEPADLYRVAPHELAARVAEMVGPIDWRMFQRRSIPT